MSIRLLTCLSLTLLTAAFGCNGDSETDSAAAGSGESPTAEFVKAVSDVEELSEKIRSGFESGDVDAAHGPLHDVGDRLNDVAKLAAESGLSEADQKVAEESVNTMFEAFGDVDKTLHGGEGATWEEVADKVKESLAKLTELRDKVAS